jgi:3-dehydroquinate synthase
MPETIHVELGDRGYDIVISHNQLTNFAPFVRQCSKATSALVVTDTNVGAHAKNVAQQIEVAGVRCGLVIRPPGEGQKSLAVAAELYDHLIELQADRQTLVVAVGGGVIGDVAGFVAATYARGLPLLMVPTTLLAMVDSSVGGKVAVNHPRAKNLIGVFHQPTGVWIDTAFLDTLPEREYRSGLAEVVKYGVIMDAEFFAFLENNAAKILKREGDSVQRLVAHCCRLKAKVVEQDERDETGLRAILNYGHTFAHAFEKAAGYGGWLHGEAVAAGMICASRLAERRGLIGADVTDRQHKLIEAFGLPTAPGDWPVADLLSTMRSDKKALAGKLRFILPRRLGEVALFDDVPEDEVTAVLVKS